MELIYHWCPQGHWQASGDEYAPPALTADGFIHCSYRHQVERTATAIDEGRDDLVLLCIDTMGLPVVSEDCYEIGEPYPHIYGPVPAEAIVAAVPFPSSTDGSFRFPPQAPS